MEYSDYGGEGTFLDLTVSHPVTTFLYRATKPRVRVDGADVAVSGWGQHRLAVEPGRRRVEVWVPYVLPRKAGRASCEIDIPRGAEFALEYMAPTVTFARGALGAPGEQTSTGHSTVMILNVVTLVVILGICLVGLLV